MGSNSNIPNEIVDRALEIARGGNRGEARDLLLELLDKVPDNARGWTALARVATDLDERRTALMNVVRLEPDNRRAQEALAKLEAQIVIAKASGFDVSSRASRSRGRRITVVILAMLAVLLVIVVAVVFLGNSATRTAEATLVARDTEVAAQITGAAATFTASFNMAETQVAELTLAAAVTATPTVLIRQTLPPEASLTPSVTPPPSPTPFPALQGGVGRLIGWGGSNAAADGYFPVVTILMANGAVEALPGTARGRHIAASSGTNVVFGRYSSNSASIELNTVDLFSGSMVPLRNSFPQGVASRQIAADEGQFTPDGRYLVFSAEVVTSGLRGVFLYDLLAPQGSPAPLRQITPDDGQTYSFPAISPDGSQVVAVQSAPAPEPPDVDLVLIDVNTGALTPWTGDGDTIRETQLRWSPDGRFVAYVGVTDADPAGDLFLRTATSPVTVINVTRSAGVDDSYPVFSPDARLLAYASDRVQPGVNIFIYDLTTGITYQSTFDDERYFPGAWIN